MKRIIIILLNVLLSAYLVAAVTFFNDPLEKATVCSEVNIHLSGTEEGLLTPREVKRMLQRERLYPLAQPLQFVSTRQMESSLQSNPFISAVQCYKTQNGHVSVVLSQREPVLYAMTTTGDSYYVDSEGQILPHGSLTANLLVVTGTFSRSYAATRLAPMACRIRDSKFWRSQTAQLNVLPDGSVELVPRVGDHIIYLGQPVNISHKLNRLRKFYKYGLSQAGWSRYRRISVEFDNQIICKK